MDNCDTFREELANSYHNCGHALWEPDPGVLYDSVQVGDVGYIRNGKFHRLFNVLLPGDHPSHSNYGVPEYHEVLRPSMEEHIDKSRDSSKNFCSRHVTEVSRGHYYSATSPDDDAQVTFSCNGRRGALLFLPFSAQREDTVARGEFGKWIVKHIDIWFAFVKNLGFGVNGIEDIILVTGFHRVRSWAYATFNGTRPGAQVSFGVLASGESSVRLEWRYAHEGELKLGPSGENLPENQCIFVRGFRIVRIMNLWPRLRGLAGPTPDTRGDETEPDSDMRLELISIPDDSNYKDPLHVLLEYIAEKSPDCDIALVHDDDLACLDGDPDTRTSHLRDISPEIQQVQWDVLHRNKTGPGIEVATAKVAILSQDTFKITHPGEHSSISIPEGKRPTTHSSDIRQGSSLEIVPERTITSSRHQRGPVVPQQRYKPPNTGDKRRFVHQIVFEPSIHFFMPEEEGIPLRDAMHGRFSSLVARDDPVFRERGPSVSIRILWPGYQPWYRQIPTRDFRIPPGPITRAKLAKNVAQSVARFIVEHQHRTMEEGGDPAWAVGPGKIDVFDLVLLRLDHVALGSWQPQLQLIRPRGGLSAPVAAGISSMPPIGAPTTPSRLYHHNLSPSPDEPFSLEPFLPSHPILSDDPLFPPIESSPPPPHGRPRPLASTSASPSSSSSMPPIGARTTSSRLYHNLSDEPFSPAPFLPPILFEDNLLSFPEDLVPHPRGRIGIRLSPSPTPTHSQSPSPPISSH